MYPWIHLPTTDLPTYAVIALIGALISGALAEHEAVKRGIHPFYMIEVLLIGAIGVLVGSHLLFFLQRLHMIGKASFWELISGSVFYGGLFGGLAAGVAFVRHKQYDMPLYADIAAFTIPLFHGIARIGCFMAGCCYGIECSFGFTMTQSDVYLANDVSRFPVQLLEASLELILFAVLYGAFFRKRKAKGKLLWIYLISYAIIRFLDEFLRGDDVLRGIYGPFSMSQWISLLVLVMAGLLYIYSKSGGSKKDGKQE